MTKGLGWNAVHIGFSFFAWHGWADDAKQDKNVAFWVGTMIRRYGETVQPNVRYRMRPGAYAILWSGQDMLVTHQAEPEPELQLPGGGVDPGENTLIALHREVMEETGWSISTPRRLGAFRRFTYMPEYGFWAEKLCHIYLARPAMRKSAPTETGHTALWMPPSEAALHLGNEGDRSFVRAFFGLRPA